MTTSGWIQLFVFLGLTSRSPRCSAATWPRSGRVARRPATGSSRRSRTASTGSAASTPTASSGGRPTRSRCWRSSAASVLLLYGIQRLQSHLPFNPDHLAAVRPDLAWNTAVSFVTNTNWQSYGGESTMSHLTQMVGLAVQNFVSAAAGLAVMVALIRGLTRRRARTIGNFWVDLIRTTFRILLPLSFVLALVLVSQGVIQNLHATQQVSTVDRAPRRTSPAARPRRRSRSSSSEPTVVGSSTRTRRIRSRTRTASRTSWRCSRS